MLPPPTETSPILIPSETFGGDDYAGVTKNREKIRRQLRSLIVYPLAYMCIWVFPFVSHVMGYNDSLNPSEPAWLMVVGLVSMCVQGTVDSLLFAIREQPWRYARGRFWSAVGRRLASSVNFWTRDAGWGWRWRGDGVMGGGAAGRTREEMLVDGRLARERREEEIVFERARAGRVAGSGGMGGGYFSGSGMKRWTRLTGRGTGVGAGIGMVGGAAKVRREWWDVDLADGAMSDEDEDDEMGPAPGRRREGSDDIESRGGTRHRDGDESIFSYSENSSRRRKEEGESRRSD